MLFHNIFYFIHALSLHGSTIHLVPVVGYASAFLFDLTISIRKAWKSYITETHHLLEDDRQISSIYKATKHNNRNVYAIHHPKTRYGKETWSNWIGGQ